MGARATKENRREDKKGEMREQRRDQRRTRKNHDAIIFVPARERILRPSGRWTEERKEEAQEV